MTMGRAAIAPSPTDPQVQAAIVSGFTQGESQRSIAGTIGIGRGTLTDWLELGQQELNSWSRGESELGSYGQLSLLIERAYATFEQRKVATLNGEGSDKEWVRDLAHVTRRNPAEWAERREVNVTHHGKITVTNPELTAAQQANLAHLLADDEPKLLPPGS